MSSIRIVSTDRVCLNGEGVSLSRLVKGTCITRISVDFIRDQLVRIPREGVVALVFLRYVEILSVLPFRSIEQCVGVTIFMEVMCDSCCWGVSVPPYSSVHTQSLHRLSSEAIKWIKCHFLV